MSEPTKRDMTKAEVIAKSDKRFAATQGRFLAMDEPFAIGERNLRRALAIAIWEARRERWSRREIEENIARLSAAQLVTEEKFQALLEVLRRRRERSQSH